MPLNVDPRRSMMRLTVAVLGIAIVWLTVLAFTRAKPVDLTIALLVVLAEVLAVAVLSGPLLAVVAALAAVGLVNWYLIPPYGTFAIDNPENIVALVVFVLVAVVAATLVEIGGRARARAEESGRRTELLSEVVTPTPGDDARAALERVRAGLRIDQVELQSDRGGADTRVLVSAGPSTSARVVLDVPLSDGYRLVGRGPELFAADPDFLASLGAAAVRAYESDLLHEETTRAEDLAAIDRARTALLASVGHDLRTPIASLRVSVETLRAPEAHLEAADRDALLATMAASTDRLDDLISNLLDMSRLQAGAVLAHPVATDVGGAVDRTLLGFPTDRLEVNVPDDLPPASADPALLERVLANLVSNALRYSPADRPVSILAHHDATTVVVEVVDHGPGISPDQTKEVFTPFHRIGAQADGGSGLGLAIVKGFAEAMDMEVDLRPGDGDGLAARLTMRRWAPDRPLR